MASAKATEAEVHSLPLLQHLAHSGRRATEGALASSGLRPRHIVALRVLSESGPASQQGLADVLSLDPSNVVGLLNELEERGLVTRRRDPSDRRRHIVELSAQGEDELLRAQRTMVRAEDDLLGALSAEERATLHDLLTRALAGQVDVQGACVAEVPPSCIE